MQLARKTPIYDCARRIGASLRDLLVLALDSVAFCEGAAGGSPETVLVVRVDHLGDFLLWSEAAVQLCHHLHARGKRIVLLADVSFAQLATGLQAFDEVWSLDRRRFVNNIGYRLRIMRRLRRAGFAVAIEPTPSRELLRGDAIVRVAGSKERVASIGDLANRYSWERWLGDKFYTQLVPAAEGIRSEVERNVEFLRGLGIECSPRLRPLSLPPAEERVISTTIAKLQPYFVIFPGATWEGKRWSISSFAELAERIAVNTGWQGVVAGGFSDRAAAKGVVALCEAPLFDLTGSTDLVDVALLLRGARLAVSNDTGAAHLGAAVSTPTVCILGGGHFKRFFPYPAGQSDSPHRSAFHRMECFNCNWQCRYYRDPGDAVPCISAISVDDVYEAVKDLLTSPPLRNADA